MSLFDFREEIIKTLRAQVPSFVQVTSHGGKFNKEELKRIAIKSPAALVTIMAAPLSREGGVVVADAQVTVFIVTCGTATVKRDQASLILAEAVADLVINNAWDYEDAQAPKSARIDNLYDGDVDRLGVAIWAVTWDQAVDIKAFDMTTLSDFDTFRAEWDLEPADGNVDATDQVNL